MTTHALPAPAKGLHYGLWTVQLLLAAAFGMAGAMKATAPIAELAQNMPWVNDVPAAMVRFIGASEFLGAVGLVAPLATGIKPRLTALAAAGLVVVMALAAAFHASRGEYAGIGINAVLGGLAAFVAWGRLR
ncbi:MAG: DoxX family protein [Myxococcota bacterium]